MGIARPPRRISGRRRGPRGAIRRSCRLARSVPELDCVHRPDRYRLLSFSAPFHRMVSVFKNRLQAPRTMIDASPRSDHGADRSKKASMVLAQVAAVGGLVFSPSRASIANPACFRLPTAIWPQWAHLRRNTIPRAGEHGSRGDECGSEEQRDQRKA
jgi:hypothetical protein